MKFHCDRCKTKYSISDDRVRGKILKIRCKNCSAVITVREPSAVGAAASTASVSAAVGAGQRPASQGQSVRGQEALAGAFKKAVTEPGLPGTGSSAAPAPVSLDAEWYLSKDGEQEGPFALEEARQWVRNKLASDDLYVWSEGYDDWLAIEKVSHFRGVRRAGAPAFDDGEEMTMVDSSGGFGFLEETPRPLFAATMAAITDGHPDSVQEEMPVVAAPIASRAPAIVRPAPLPQPRTLPARAPAIPQSARAPAIPQSARAPVIPQSARAPVLPSSASAPALPSYGTPAAGEDAAASLEFDIGEASRVVDLPTLLAQRGNAPAFPSAGNQIANQMPGVDAGLGRGSGATHALSYPGTLTAVAGADLPPAASSETRSKKRRSIAVPLVAAGVLIAAAAGLLIYFMTEHETASSIARGSVGGSGNLGYSFNDTGQRVKAPAPDDATEDSTAGTGKPKSTKIRKSTGGAKNGDETNSVVRATPTRDSHEVDLTGSGDQGPTGPLDGEDLMQVYRKNNLALKMCYERSLKKDPLLKVPKTWVDIQVGLDGRVSSVKIPSLANTELGSCILGRISRWRFRQTTELFSSRFPLVFGS